jgi:SnoaL-like domain
MILRIIALLNIKITMEIEKIAQRLILLCRSYSYFEAHEEIFWPDAESFEPGESQDKGTKGVRNIEKKWEQFQQMFHPGSMEIGEPIFAGNFFSLSVTQQVTLREAGQPLTLQQLAVYEVRDGKIAKEWFYYPK